MLRRQAVLFRNGLFVLDVLIATLCFPVAVYIRQFLAFYALKHPERLPGWVVALDLPKITEFRAYELLFFAVPIMWAAALYFAGTRDFRVTYRDMAWRYLKAVALGLGFIVTIAFLFKVHAVARTFVVLYGALAFGLLVPTRIVVMEVAAFLRKKRVDGHRMVIVGCGEQAVAIAQSLRNQPHWNIKLLGHVTMEGEVCHAEAEPRLEKVEHLDRLLDREPIDEVLFAVPGLPHEILAGALVHCDERGVDVLLPLPPALPTHGEVEVTHVEGFDFPLLGFRRTPTGVARLAVKRAMDLLGGLFALSLAAPVMAAVAAAIKLSSPGPVLFKQVRSGRNGRKFVMYKFRSMVVDAEARRAQLLHLNEMSGPVFKITRDPRVTRVGAFIRKTSLDELPQLFNIVLGDMSLVGPRPPLPAEVDQYKPWQRRRLSVKPGLTGLWQVSGRNNVDFEEWMALDLRYIDNWSLLLDFKILLRTLPAVIFKTGAS